MLADAYNRGQREALARYGIKEAAVATPPAVPPAPFKERALGFAKDTGKALFGDWGRAANEFKTVTPEGGRQIFQQGGMLHPRELLWGSLPKDPKWYHHAALWGNRIGTGLAAYEAFDALRGGGDPNKGRLEKALGAVGGGLGWAFGGPLGGMLLSPMIAAGGRSLGEAAGRLIGGRPQPPQPAPAQPYAGPPQGAYPAYPDPYYYR